MKAILKFILLPFKLLVGLVCILLLKMFDDYNEAFKNGWIY
jgi:hypothetical protein